jgi:hypothetical protein
MFWKRGLTQSGVKKNLDAIQVVMLVFGPTDKVVSQFASYELFNPRLGSTSVKRVGLFSLQLELEGFG